MNWETFPRRYQATRERGIDLKTAPFPPYLLESASNIRPTALSCPIIIFLFHAFIHLKGLKHYIYLGEKGQGVLSVRI